MPRNRYKCNKQTSTSIQKTMERKAILARRFTRSTRRHGCARLDSPDLCSVSGLRRTTRSCPVAQLQPQSRTYSSCFRCRSRIRAIVSNADRAKEDPKSSDSRSHRVVVRQAEQDANEDDVQQRNDVAELRRGSRMRQHYVLAVGCAARDDPSSARGNADTRDCKHTLATASGRRQ